MQVKFSKIAKFSLQENIKFLESKWTILEINNFLDDVDEVTENLQKGKHLHYQKYSRDIRSALIGKRHVRVYFRIESKSVIKILLYFPTKQDPKKLYDFLKL